MATWIIAGWLFVGVAMTGLIVSVYRELLKYEDASDWLDE